MRKIRDKGITMPGPVVLFRFDLRLIDNPALRAAGPNACHVFILDPKAEYGGAQKWWLHHSLKALDRDLKKEGSKGLIIIPGDTKTILSINPFKDSTIFVNHSPDPWTSDWMKLPEFKDRVKVYDNGYLLNNTLRGSSSARNQAQFGRENKHTPRKALTKPDFQFHDQWNSPFITTDGAVNLLLPLPTKPDWAKEFNMWTPGETGAWDRLNEWKSRITPEFYGSYRGYPSTDATSRLSPHIRFGEISEKSLVDVLGVGHPLIHELIWREFKHDQFVRFPFYNDLECKERLRNFPWIYDYPKFEKWCMGQTGFPIVDAGMQELWRTGFMDNRVRMIVASFLTKLLLMDWRLGAKWFMDTLCDADLAINATQWQSSMGSGYDSRDYQIIMNPDLQHHKFDADSYIQKWAPYSKNLPRIVDYNKARDRATKVWEDHNAKFTAG